MKKKSIPENEDLDKLEKFEEELHQATLLIEYDSKLQQNEDGVIEVEEKVGIFESDPLIIKDLIESSTEVIKIRHKSGENGTNIIYTLT